MARLISHIILSIVVLISATGLTVNLHFCQNKLYDFALIVPADNCRETGMHEYHFDHDSDMDNSNHCNDETIKVEPTGDYFVSTFLFNFKSINLTNLFFTTQLLFEDQGTTDFVAVKIHNYKKPPTPEEVDLSQIQSFLI